MRRMEGFPAERPGPAEGETTAETQAEVDLICGGVGFDDGPAEESRWLKEARERARELQRKKKGV